MQGLSFLQRYYGKRISSGDPGLKQEAEYNMGRALHQIGLFHLALPHYEAVLNTKGVASKFDLSVSAAYNMQLIYVLAGNPGKARELTHKYLAI